MFDKEIGFSWFSTFRVLKTEAVCVGDESFSTDDDTDCEERGGGGGVNNIIQQKSTWALKKRQNLCCYLPLAMLLFHTNTYICIVYTKKYVCKSRAHHCRKEEQDDKEWFALLLMILSKIIVVNPSGASKDVCC